MIKSSTVYIRDEDGKISGIFGINYDISPMVVFQKELQDFINIDTVQAEESTHIYHDVNSMLDDLIKRAVKMIGRPVAYMTREDKIKAMHYLDEHGAFLITKSGDKISYITAFLIVLLSFPYDLLVSFRVCIAFC